MPKKKRREPQDQQNASFRVAVEPMIAVGELNPTKADEALYKITRFANLDQ